MVYLLHLALEALDKGQCYVRLFFAGFKKGFDLIDHTILIRKLVNLEVFIIVFSDGRLHFCWIVPGHSHWSCGFWLPNAAWRDSPGDQARLGPLRGHGK